MVATDPEAPRQQVGVPAFGTPATYAEGCAQTSGAYLGGGGIRNAAFEEDGKRFEVADLLRRSTDVSVIRLEANHLAVWLVRGTGW